MDKNISDTKFPQDLLKWSGHHSGGVKRLFDPRSGRPGKELLRTSLIARLETWAKQVANMEQVAPRILLLVGGPGNGKTEAIEHTIYCIDDELGASGQLVSGLSDGFHPAQGHQVPRLVRIDAGTLASRPRPLVFEIVQDATVVPEQSVESASQLLIRELIALLEGPPERHYLCCVNRGVLDDALIYAIDNGQTDVRELLEVITRSVSLSSDAPSCWPLKGYESIAVWPMDSESLMISPYGIEVPPASVLFSHAVKSDHWPITGTCPAGENCPFCQSQAILSQDDTRASLLQVLRWYELASGKRWSFRDLFTLISYLLAGHRPDGLGKFATPCEWASRLLELDKEGQFDAKPGKQKLVALFELAMSGYQHALFHRWDPDAAQVLRQGIKDLGLAKGGGETRTLIGLQQFLAGRKDPYLPAPISSLLENIVETLDPALASGDLEIPLSSRKTVTLAEIDLRFSRSVYGATQFLKKFNILSNLEFDLLQRLAKADILLSSAEVRRKNPAAANRIQRLIRDFSCRLVRRSLCTRVAIVPDKLILEEFRQIIDQDERGQRLFEVARQVKDLLNGDQGFEVSLTTTFGQPLPPPQRQASLVVPVRQVRNLKLPSAGRPRSPIAYLSVGSGQSMQPIPLTYELFKAVKELERGLSPASLPRTVVALLDTTKAMLSGPIVRDAEVLVDARIKVGSDGTEIGSSWDGFMAIERETKA